MYVAHENLEYINFTINRLVEGMRSMRCVAEAYLDEVELEAAKMVSEENPL